MKNIFDGNPTDLAASADDEDTIAAGWRNGWIGLAILLWGVLGFAAAIAATLD
jgi:hypothetical protein